MLILSVSLSLVFHNAAKAQELTAIRDYAMLVSDLLDKGVTGDYLFSDYLNAYPAGFRLTIVAPDGAVLLDSKVSAQLMENHADRPEIIQALRTGAGESLRYSETMWNEMYYYAVRLKDGNVLRVSIAVAGLSGVFAIALPIAVAVTILVLVAAVFATRRLTERIIAPIEHIDFDGGNIAVYEELVPYAARINRQSQEIKEKMAQLSDRAGTIEAITGNMKEGLILIDSGALTLMANNSAQDIFGDKMERKNVMHICRDMEFQDAVKQCLAGKNAEIQMERGERVYSVFLSPVNSDGSLGAVILFHDATDRHRAEKQRREFSANVSHELKTPLTTISALSELIESGIAKENDIKGFAARISEQAGRLIVLINDIIRLSEFDEGGTRNEDTVFDLWELAETVIGALKGNTANIEILLTGERFDISANYRMIDELLYNLIDNGVKYNRDGGRVTVELKREGTGLCCISVSDTGIGIPLEHQEHVFERFYRVDKSRSKKTGGTGLGLSIVKHITEYYNGRIELHSTAGNGTTIACYLAYLA